MAARCWPWAGHSHPAGLIPPFCGTPGGPADRGGRSRNCTDPRGSGVPALARSAGLAGTAARSGPGEGWLDLHRRPQRHGSRPWWVPAPWRRARSRQPVPGHRGRPTCGLPASCSWPATLERLALVCELLRPTSRPAAALVCGAGGPGHVLRAAAAAPRRWRFWRLVPPTPTPWQTHPGAARLGASLRHRHPGHAPNLPTPCRPAHSQPAATC